MAIWHFELALLPADSKPPRLTNHGWVGQPLDRESVALLRPFISGLLGRNAAHTSCTDPKNPAVGSVLSYGSQDGNRIDLVDRGEEGIEAWATIDARSDADAFCAFLCQLASFWDCEFLSLELQTR